MGITALSYRLCLSVARSPSEVVLTLQEASFVLWGTQGRGKPPLVPHHTALGQLQPEHTASAQLLRDRDHKGSGGFLGHTQWRNPAAILISSLWEPLKGFIPFATVRSQTTVAISWGLIKGSLVQLLQVSVLVVVIKTLSLGTLLPPTAEGEQVCRGRSPS